MKQNVLKIRDLMQLGWRFRFLLFRILFSTSLGLRNVFPALNWPGYLILGGGLSLVLCYLRFTYSLRIYLLLAFYLFMNLNTAYVMHTKTRILWGSMIAQDGLSS